MRCRYLAGHWDVQLVKQLGWRLLHDRWNRSGDYRAPSWSWASVDGQIDSVIDDWLRNSPDKYYPLVKVLESHIELAGDDEMGQVKGGYLKLLGQTMDVELEEIRSMDKVAFLSTGKKQNARW